MAVGSVASGCGSGRSSAATKPPAPVSSSIAASLAAKVLTDAVKELKPAT
ncbi:hypothetical protein ABH920_001993 [Catenulispora sp. EB89]